MATNPGSPSWHLLPGGVPAVLSPSIRIVSAAGTRLKSDSGATWTDLAMGYGAVSIGHGEPCVCRAVARRVRAGTLFPANTPDEEKARSVLRSMFPHTREATFHKTGSEAVATAIRLARAHTGRQWIVRCGFHGWHDEWIHPARRWHGHERTRTEPVSGVLNVPSRVVAWLDAKSSTLAPLLAARDGKIAAVIVDAIQLDDRARDLAAIRRLCRLHGVLLILDELKTCPRVALGGVQEARGIAADLTIVGKGLANGIAFAAVLGPAWIAEVRRPARIMGTFNGDLLGFAALEATCRIFQDEDGPTRINALGEVFIAACNEEFSKYGFGGKLRMKPYSGWSATPSLWVTSEFSPRLDAFFQTVAADGVILLRNHMQFIALRHRPRALTSAARTIARAAARSFPDR